MGRKRVVGNITNICVTQELPEGDKYLGVWFDHCKDMNRPCAIIKRFCRGKMSYSVWRAIQPDELFYFQGIDKLDQLDKFELIKEFGGFGEILASG